ncbi:hypothetical protein DSECCO2_68730 [anaerobic digester metagenome]
MFIAELRVSGLAGIPPSRFRKNSRFTEGYLVSFNRPWKSRWLTIYIHNDRMRVNTFYAFFYFYLYINKLMIYWKKLAVLSRLLIVKYNS